MNEEHFFKVARERYEIMLKRQAGEPAPWTDDPVLQGFYFCNVFREDDKTTTWLRNNVREPLKGASLQHIITAVAGFRWFNHIPTGELIKDILVEKGWDATAVRKAVRGQKQLWSGAYIIMPQPGVSAPKLDGVIHCMRGLKAKQLAKHIRNQVELTLEATHRELMTRPGMGPFMAYEVITDLNHTKVLAAATDRYTWANPGPGCLRGLDWVWNDEIKHTRSRQGLQRCNNHMWELLQLSRPTSFMWPEEWPQWDMRTVEHWLCEYDKYRRGQEGSHLKRRYQHGK